MKQSSACKKILEKFVENYNRKNFSYCIIFDEPVSQDEEILLPIKVSTGIFNRINNSIYSYSCIYGLHHMLIVMYSVLGCSADYILNNRRLLFCS